MDKVLNTTIFLTQFISKGNAPNCTHDQIDNGLMKHPTLVPTLKLGRPENKHQQHNLKETAEPVSEVFVEN